MNQLPEILVVDDNPADVTLVRESLAETRYRQCIRSVSDAAGALQYLKRSGKYASMVRPGLVFLDLNLPRTRGHEVLAALKSEASLSPIPVVVFSSSTAPSDVTLSYELGANCYVIKPANLKGFIAAVRSIVDFWFGCACLPQENPVWKESNERSSCPHPADRR
jgi:two-component system, chemotaxis family, response regulator Rcp1